MDIEQKMQIATQYALSVGYDIVSHEVDTEGSTYFCITREDLMNTRTGIAAMIKIGPNGELERIYDKSERLWVIRQRNLLIDSENGQ